MAKGHENLIYLDHQHQVRGRVVELQETDLRWHLRDAHGAGTDGMSPRLMGREHIMLHALMPSFDARGALHQLVRQLLDWNRRNH